MHLSFGRWFGGRLWCCLIVCAKPARGVDVINFHAAIVAYEKGELWQQASMLLHIMFQAGYTEGDHVECSLCQS